MTRKVPSGWQFVAPDGKLSESVGILLPPMPVRSDGHGDVLGGPRVDLGAILRQLKAYLEEHPEALPLYRRPGAALAYAHGVALGRNGEPATAAEVLRLGLTLDPGNAALAANYALAVVSLGHLDAAAAVFRALLRDPTVTPGGVLLVVAAKVLREAGDARGAADALRRAAPSMPRDAMYWELLGTVETEAAAGSVLQTIAGSLRRLFRRDA